MNYTNAKAIKVISYLSPDPLDEDSGIEPEFLEWIPGFDSTDTDDEYSLYRESNVAIYEKIQDFVSDQFRKGLENMFPLLKDHLFKNIQISIDLFGMIFQSNTALASYSPEFSQPEKGKYLFNIHHRLFCKYIKEMNGEKVENFDDSFIWEHELIHLLDHYEIVRGSLYKASNSSDEIFKYQLLKYREEGIADLYSLLNANFSTIRTEEEAKKQFLLKMNQAKTRLSSSLEINETIKNEILSGYHFYEIGPWLIMDLLKQFEGGWFADTINESFESIKNGKPVTKETLLDIIKIACRIRVEDFLFYVEALDK